MPLTKLESRMDKCLILEGEKHDFLIHDFGKVNRRNHVEENITVTFIFINI